MCLFKNLFFTTQATLTPAKNEIRETESDIAIVVVFVLMLFSLLSLSSLTSGCRTSFLETSNFTIGEKFQKVVVKLLQLCFVISQSDLLSRWHWPDAYIFNYSSGTNSFQKLMVTGMYEN